MLGNITGSCHKYSWMRQTMNLFLEDDCWLHPSLRFGRRFSIFCKCSSPPTSLPSRLRAMLCCPLVHSFAVIYLCAVCVSLITAPEAATTALHCALNDVVLSDGILGDLHNLEGPDR